MGSVCAEYPVNCHTTVGNGIFSSFFDDTDGFNFSDKVQTNNENVFCSINDLLGYSVQTQAYGKTSLGYALQDIGESARHATDVHNLSFSATSGSVPVLIGSEHAVKGWLLEDAVGNENIVLLNMSDQDITVDFNLTGFNDPERMKIISIGNSVAVDRLNTFITRTDDAVDPGMVDYVIYTNGSAMESSDDIPAYENFNNGVTIPAFSIVRYYYSANNNYTVEISVSESSVCSGRDFYLYANGGPEALSY